MVPLHDGQVTVIVHDLCLISSETSATAIVYVSGIYRFDVQVVEKVIEINEFICSSCYCEVRGFCLY